MSNFIRIFVFSFLFLTACKSEFEKIRISGDVDKILNKAFSYYEKEEYLKSQTLFELVLSSIKGRTESEKAYFQYAYCHYHLHEYILGAYYFKNFANTFTSSPLREEALYMAAYSNYKLSPIYKLEQSNTIKAIDDFQTFVNLFPSSDRVNLCNQLIDEMRRKLEQKAYAEGELYYNLRQYQSAVISFDNLLRDYPETPEAEQVLFLIAKSQFLLADNSVVEKQVDRFNETIRRCDDFVEKYPSGKFTKEIKQVKKESNAKISEVKKRLKDGKV